MDDSLERAHDDGRLSVSRRGALAAPASRELVVTEWRNTGRIGAVAPQIASRLAPHLPGASGLRIDALAPEEIEAHLAAGGRVVLVIRPLHDDFEEMTHWSYRALARRDICPSDLILAVADVRISDLGALTERVIGLPRWPHLWIAN